MLEGRGISKNFGGLVALKDVDFSVEAGEIVGLIGPNGSGKTTLFNVSTGVFRPSSGSIWLEGEDITGLRPHAICRRGVGRTFQVVRPFEGMTALENVMVGAFYSGRDHAKGPAQARKEALKWMEYVGLLEKRETLTRDLPLLDRKRLELARALATHPKILLLDEVMAGLNPAETLDAIQLIQRIHKELHIAILIVEHVMKVIMGVSHRILVLHHGAKIAEGPPEAIARDPAVIEAYLGEAYAEV